MTGVYRQVYLSLLSRMGSRVTMSQVHLRNMGHLPQARLYWNNTKKITSMAASQAWNTSPPALFRAPKTQSQLNYDATSVGMFTQGFGRKDLKRHCEERHLDREGYFCPFAGCKYSQEKGVGIKRKSNWQRHVQTQHRG
ncbi:hypothetical protein BDP67DRAFT_601279 [Colletotrichum lupini]|nr:hypothetical protein BDP67DRAFT_601279 [Colletotrichum lupini]